jgi:hypothetical protein
VLIVLLSICQGLGQELIKMDGSIYCHRDSLSMHCVQDGFLSRGMLGFDRRILIIQSLLCLIVSERKWLAFDDSTRGQTDDEAVKLVAF